MVNEHLRERLKGIQAMLMSAYESGKDLSAATKGYEREIFIRTFLSRVLPPPFRFGLGEITDSFGNKSGQLDIVVEYPFLPSLPLPGVSDPRLYLAEGVAAVIEVKSNLQSQWNEVERSASAVAEIRRSVYAAEPGGFCVGEQVPYFAVGYKGWKTTETVVEKLHQSEDAGILQGILVVENGVFVATGRYGVRNAKGPLALWGLLACLQRAANAVLHIPPDLGMYAD